MNFKTFFEHRIQGWLPEEPKMPKNKFKAIRMQNVAIIMGVTAVFSLLSPFFWSISPLAAAPLSMVIENVPNSSYVEFKGILEEDNIFIINLNNGTCVKSENLMLSFLITETSGNKCTVNITFECDCFSSEAIVNGSIVDGNLVVDSTRSLFLINPNVTKNQNIMLTETDDWNLTAYVRSETLHPSTAIEPYAVSALIFSSFQSHPSAKPIQMFWLGYDPNSGILIYSGYSLSDVLLEKVGINLLYGGSLELLSYSKKLNLEFYNFDIFWTQLNIKVFCFYSGFALLVATSVIVAAYVIIRKIRKRRQLPYAKHSEFTWLILHKNVTK